MPFEPTNVYQWMLVNVNELVRAIEEDGRMGGPKSDPLLDAASRMDSSGNLKNQARTLLRQHLALRKLDHLLP